MSARIFPYMMPVSYTHLDVYKRQGLVFPIYAWGAPGIVAEFLDAWEQNNDAYRYGVCTCGDDAGYGMEKLRKRFPWNAAWSVAMPNNYIPMYDVDSPGAVSYTHLDVYKRQMKLMLNRLDSSSVMTLMVAGSKAPPE